jgi:ATP-dependent helicase YprA (DUF1998 family)
MNNDRHTGPPSAALDPDILQQFSPQELVIAQLVDAVQSASLDTLWILARTFITPEQLPPDELLCHISESQQMDVLRGCLLVLIHSNGKKVPRKFQLEATLGPLNGRDVVVSSATGSGKTLIMILLLLLRPKEHAILIVPLKRLQHAQVSFTQHVIMYCS